jgi:GNAT superfamily N-acetyltransferase
MNISVEIVEAHPEDAQEMAEIHLKARRVAMPYLKLAHSEDETRGWFARSVGDRPKARWLARQDGMLIDGEDLDHLYVQPEVRRRGIGLALLHKAKALSPQRISLFTFQRNFDARAFYEAQGFHAVEFTDGHSNEENEPDIRYVWRRRRRTEGAGA